MTLPMTSGSGAAAIVAELRTAISDGHYAYGQRLPAERELAAHFGASRTTVREALRQLESLGLVIRRIGSGTFVDQPASRHGDIAERTSPLELMEVREAIEPHLARLAVAHASAKDLELLDKAIQDLEASGARQEVFSKADEAFHLAIAEATGNPLMAGIYDQINQVRSHDQWNAMKRKVLNDEAIAIYNQQHRALVEAIRQRDVDAAVTLVTDHLAQARRDLVGVRPPGTPGAST